MRGAAFAVSVGVAWLDLTSFGHYDWFTEIDYSALKTVPVFPPASKGQNDTIDQQITALQNQNAKLVLASHQLSPTGKAYQALIKNGPER